MKTIAIIAEYNPFHNGHLFLLKKAMEITDADYCISIMSGNFMQRGTPAICNKFTRAHMAVSSGMDLCLELPFVYATGSAYDFANGAVNILNSLNTVDYLCFGAENDDLELFDMITTIITDEPSGYSSILKTELKSGRSYPAARQSSILNHIKHQSESEKFPYKKYDKKVITEILSMPNNILAIEYLAALKRTNSKIKPLVIKRESSEYNDEKLSGNISSALSVRKALYNQTVPEGKDINSIFNKLKNTLPDSSLTLLKEMYKKEYPLQSNALIPFIQDKILTGKEKYSNICDFTPALLNKLFKSDLRMDYSELIELLKSKDITKTRINRALVHMILEYTSTDREMFYENGTAYYASILSFKKSCTELIKNIKDKSTIPLITKKSDFEKCLKDYPDINEVYAKRMWELDIMASKLYGNLVYNNLGTVIPNDFTANLPIV